MLSHEDRVLLAKHPYALSAYRRMVRNWTKTLEAYRVDYRAQRAIILEGTRSFPILKREQLLGELISTRSNMAWARGQLALFSRVVALKSR